jgi:transposase
MLRPWQHVPCSDFDQQVFEALVPANHYLRRVKAALDFEKVRPILAACYPSSIGRPAVEPVLLLKLEFLEFHYNLSDREVIAEAQVNVAFRFFLDLSLHSALPHHTLLTYFRERLGVDHHQKVFDAVVGQARQRGLVKDRLRLKDATHVIANIAVPSTIRLVAQVREHVLAAAEPWWPDWVAQQRDHAAQVRVTTASLSDGERLLQRVTQLRQIAAELEQRLDQSEQTTDLQDEHRPLREALRLAQRVLADRSEHRPDGKSDRVLSLHDPEARTAKHGTWYDGYLLDVAMDADSEIVTAVNVLPANGDEGADTVALVTQEEKAHQNDVATVSLDGAGFRGSLLRELTDPQGLNLEVITPPSPERQGTTFAAEVFTLDERGEELTCPNGQKTRWRSYNPGETGWRFRFATKACAACPLRAQCLQKPEKPTPRLVLKNLYEAEYRRARAKAQTPEYAKLRQEHPKIERKLGEMVRWHRARRARYWGRAKVLVQDLLTAVVVNLKRMVHLLAVPKAVTSGSVRAETAPTG